MAEARPKLRIAVLISGGGSTLRNLLELSATGRLDAEIVGVAASRKCAGLAHAEEFSVPHAIIRRGKPFDAADFSARLTAQLDQWRPGLIALGGFLSLYIIPPQYANRVINTHPALLPAFGGKGMYGDHVHEAVLASGTKVSGCSVHIVNNEYDAGQVLAQRTVAVLDGDTVESLGARVRATERELYPQVVQWFAEGRVQFAADGTVVIGERSF